MDCDVAALLAMTGAGSMRLSEQLGWLDCDVATLLAVTEMRAIDVVGAINELVAA